MRASSTSWSSTTARSARRSTATRSRRCASSAGMCCISTRPTSPSSRTTTTSIRCTSSRGLMNRWADKELLSDNRRSYKSRTHYDRDSIRSLIENLASEARGKYGTVILSYRDKAFPTETRSATSSRSASATCASGGWMSSMALSSARRARASTAANCSSSPRMARVRPRPLRLRCRPTATRPSRSR